MQKRMGLGINLGNRLDLQNTPNRTVNESWFMQFAAQGFTNARVPVCWNGHTVSGACDRWIMKVVEHEIQS